MFYYELYSPFLRNINEDLRIVIEKSGLFLLAILAESWHNKSSDSSKLHWNLKAIVFAVKPVDIPSNQVVLNQSIDSIRVELNGYGYNLAKYYMDQPIIEISLNDLKKSKSKYEWSKQRNFSDLESKFGKSVTLIST